MLPQIKGLAHVRALPLKLISASLTIDAEFSKHLKKVRRNAPHCILGISSTPSVGTSS